MRRDDLNAWIMARKAEGCWVQCCLACGSWFAQPRAGRPGNICDRRVCILAFRWQRKNGRMPPDSMWKLWRKRYGEAQQYRATTSVRFDSEAAA